MILAILRLAPVRPVPLPPYLQTPNYTATDLLPHLHRAARSSSSSTSSHRDDTEITKVARYIKKQSKKNKSTTTRESIPDRLREFPTSLPKSTTIRHWKLDLQRSIVRAAKSEGKKARKWLRKCWPDSGASDSTLHGPGIKFY